MNMKPNIRANHISNQLNKVCICFTGTGRKPVQKSSIWRGGGACSERVSFVLNRNLFKFASQPLGVEFVDATTRKMTPFSSWWKLSERRHRAWGTNQQVRSFLLQKWLHANHHQSEPPSPPFPTEEIGVMSAVLHDMYTRRSIADGPSASGDFLRIFQKAPFQTIAKRLAWTDAEERQQAWWAKQSPYSLQLPCRWKKGWKKIAIIYVARRLKSSLLT